MAYILKKKRKDLIINLHEKIYKQNWTNIYSFICVILFLYKYLKKNTKQTLIQNFWLCNNDWSQLYLLVKFIKYILKFIIE